MKVTIRSSGGIMGYRHKSEKKLDTANLAGKEKAAFSLDELKSLSSRPRTEGAADVITYHFSVIDDDGDLHKFDISESDMPAEMIDAIDAAD